MDTEKMLNLINSLYYKYINSRDYVYYSYDNYIIIMKRLDNTYTDESSGNIVNSNTALFRGNNFEVVLIFKIDNPTETIPSIVKKYYDFVNYNMLYNTGNIIYNIGDIVEKNLKLQIFLLIKDKYYLHLNH